MTINSVTCANYSKRIGNEVGWLEQIVQEGIKAFESRIIPSDPVSVFGVIRLNKQAEHSAHRMQIVYLVNLFESFMHDFIGEKDGLSESQMNEKRFWETYLETERKMWDEYCTNHNEPINTSKSFMNIRYSVFVIEERYKIKYPSYLSPLVLELGSLRNCLVHYDGELLHQDKGGKYFKDTLSKTIDFLKVDPNSNRITEINRNGYLGKVTFDLATFIELCGGFIRRPIDHKNEK